MTTEGTPTVTIVVPVRDDADGLGRCLEALDRQDYPRELYDIVVVDNGSTVPPDATVAGHPRTRLLHEPREGSYAARNHGIAWSNGEIVAFTDADCIPSPTWLRAGVAALLAHPEAGAVAGRIEVFARHPRRPRAVEAYEMVHAFPQQRYAQQHHFGATANLLTWRRVVGSVGPFDDTLRSGGDREWGVRVHASGYDIVYAHDACVRHPARATPAQLHAKLVRVHRGERMLVARGCVAPRVSWRNWVPPVGSILRVLRGSALPDLRSRLAYARGIVIARYLGVWVRTVHTRGSRPRQPVAGAQSASS